MWSRVRHRRLQALALVALAALLTTSLCLGPLYQRAMEQALAGSVLGNASGDQQSFRLSSTTVPPADLEAELPGSVARWFTAPSVSRAVPVSVRLPQSSRQVATRLYAVDGACAHLHLVRGRCPAAAGEVMVSSADEEVNGWTVGAWAPFVERLPPAEFPTLSDGKVTVVGVYRTPGPDADWLGAPITGRAGSELQDVGLATDDWVTDPKTMTTSTVGTWHQIAASVAWTVDPEKVDHDALLWLGPRVEAVEYRINTGGARIVVSTDLPGLADRVATGSEQGRTTVVVLVAQLLVLVAVVLWMVLVAATDDRRPELALARLRGRGRRGAVAYLLAELVPLTLAGVVLGVLAAPFAMALVARVVFPVDVPLEAPGGFLLAALGAAVAVLAVVLAAAWRAAREPVDSLLRAVRPRHAGGGGGAVEAALVVFSLTAVVALLTGNLEGPLATLAPTLLAFAVGLLLARALVPAVRAASRRLLHGGRAVAAAGIVTAVRRPAARRVLVMVVVATSLLVFCVDAMVTGQRNRQNAAEQLNGAPYSMSVQPVRLADLVAALAAADPGHEHLTPVVTTVQAGSTTAPTVAVDSVAFPRVASFPLSRPSRHEWEAIAPPDVEPVRLTGQTLAGTVASSGFRLSGPSAKRVDEVVIGLEVMDGEGRTLSADLSVVPQGQGTAPFSASVPCEGGCTVTGVAMRTPPGGVVHGSVVLRDLVVDGHPFSLGTPDRWLRVREEGGSSVPVTDAAGNLGVEVGTDGSTPPVMLSAWVPRPVPVLVSADDENDVFTGPGLDSQVDMAVAGRLPRVPGSPPGSRVVDLAGMLRLPEGSVVNLVVEVWGNDPAALQRAADELRKRGATVGGVTSVTDVRADLDASPAAWSLALSVLVALAALLVAVLVMIVSTATTWRARATDLAALRMAGLPSRSLRRMEGLGQLPVVLVGGIAGAVSGAVAAVEALPGLRQFTDVPAVDTRDFSVPWLLVVLGALLGVLLLAGLAVATARWTARRAALARIKEVGW